MSKKLIVCPTNTCEQSLTNKVYYRKGFGSPIQCYLKIGERFPHIFLGEGDCNVKPNTILMNKIQRRSCKGCLKGSSVNVEIFEPEISSKENNKLKIVTFECKYKNEKYDIPESIDEIDVLETLSNKLENHILVLQQMIAFEFEKYVIFEVKNIEFDNVSDKTKIGMVSKTTKFVLTIKEGSKLKIKENLL